MSSGLPSLLIPLRELQFELAQFTTDRGILDQAQPPESPAKACDRAGGSSDLGVGRRVMLSAAPGPAAHSWLPWPLGQTPAGNCGPGGNVAGLADEAIFARGSGP